MSEDSPEFVTVPDVVGLAFHVARDLAAEHGTPANPDPDGPPVGALAWPGLFYTTSQEPQAGAIVKRHSSVRAETVGHGPAEQNAVRLSPKHPPANNAQASAGTEQNLDLSFADTAETFSEGS